MKLDLVVNGVAQFAEAEILPTLDGSMKWGGAFAVGLIKSQANILVNNLLNESPYMKTLGIISDDGDLDIEALLNSAKNAGVLELNVPVFGKFKFNKTSFESLEEYIKAQEK